MTKQSLAQQNYIKKNKQHKWNIRYSRFSIFILFLFLWEGSTQVGLLDSFIFSSPSRIVMCFYDMTKNQTIFLHIGITLLETLASFFLVMFFGLLTSILLWLYRPLSEILEPYLVILNSLPKSALAPLLIVWLGANTTTIIVAGISVAIFGTIINLFTGFSEVDSDKIKLIYTLKGTKQDVLFRVVLPSTVPNIISTMKVNIGLSLVGVVIGEFLASRAGLGYLIIYGSQVFKLDWVMMSIILLCIIAVLLYQMIHWMENKYSKFYS